MWWERRSQPDVLLGEGRFIRLKDDPYCADIAVSMTDALHGPGGGNAAHARARPAGSRGGPAPLPRGDVPGQRAVAPADASRDPVLRDAVTHGEREIVVDIPVVDRADDPLSAAQRVETL
jgi:hypothetical protein